jgi:hypothetical protein
MKLSNVFDDNTLLYFKAMSWVNCFRLTLSPAVSNILVSCETVFIHRTLQSKLWRCRRLGLLAQARPAVGYILIPERQVFYRQTRTSMSSKVPKMEQEQIHVPRCDFSLSSKAIFSHSKSIALFPAIYFYGAQLCSRQPPGPKFPVA